MEGYHDRTPLSFDGTLAEGNPIMSDNDGGPPGPRFRLSTEGTIGIVLALVGLLGAGGDNGRASASVDRVDDDRCCGRRHCNFQASTTLVPWLATKRPRSGAWKARILHFMEEPPQHWLRQVRRYFVLKWLPQFLLSLLAYWWLSISRTGIGGHLLFAMLFWKFGDGSLVQTSKRPKTIFARSLYGQ